jgi:hypothetical protein
MNQGASPAIRGDGAKGLSHGVGLDKTYQMWGAMQIWKRKEARFKESPLNVESKSVTCRTVVHVSIV